MPYANPEHKKANARRWWAENRLKQKAYRASTREHRTETHRAWRKEHLAERASSQRAYRLRFPGASQTRSRIANVLKGRVKSAPTIVLLGCEWDAFCWYLELQFRDGMTWENYGSVWEIDHVLPISWFDQTDEQWQFKAFHFSNHQPLFVVENRRKGNRYVV